jgi:glycogen debranching enzyme
MNLIDEGYHSAVEALKHCVTKKGLYASGVPEGYTSVWSRDANIALLGGALVGATFKKAFRDTLNTLAKNQSHLGQIPNTVGLYDQQRKSDVTYNTIDSSLWYLIGVHVFESAYKEPRTLMIHKDHVDRALTWIQYRDMSEDLIPEQLPTTDWEDAFPHKYGHTINTQALYYAALRMVGKRGIARVLQKFVNGSRKFPHLALFDKGRGYYLPWAWKDHAGDREEEYWFDSLGNLLAIVTGLATPKMAKTILDHIEKNRIDRPSPVRVIDPPIAPGGPHWKSYYDELGENRLPHQYLNGGIWPFIGGFYIAALVKARRYEKATEELGRLATANKQGKEKVWEFNEWLDGNTGKPKGGVWQAWSIGMYIFAYECVKRKKVPFFS